MKDHRAHVISALRKAGIFVDPMEDWTASSEEPKKFGTKRLEGCDLCILLVAFRRGHVPEGEQKSITQMEYNAAKEKGIDVLVYMLDEDAPWPRKFDELDKDPQMRPWRETLLEHRGVTLFDLKPDSIDIGPALFRWKNEKSGSTGHDVTLAETYLTTLLDEFKSIEVRGVKVSDAQAHRLDIEKLYTPLHITGSIDDLNDVTGSKLAHRRQTGDKVSLDKVLKHRAAVIIGDPGAGKSTFLKRIVTILCRTWLGHDPGNSSTRLGLSPAPFPVFVRLFDLASHIRQCRESGEKGCPSGEDNPAWVFHYLGSLSTDRRWGLTREWFERQCDTEEGIAILLDGLDETPDKLSRNNIIKLVNKLKNDRPCCRLVVTSRPVAFEESVPLRGFYRCDIASLDDEGVNTFIRQWCDALYFDTPEIAKKHFEELRHEVFARAAIRRMAANPVMLTALAVVHWNNKRLPEQRAELYESVIGWLLDSRDMKRPGRIGRDECREHLQMIALSMQSWKGGRQQSLERGEMIDLLAKEMSAPDEKKRRSMAEKFIEHEELDSGIIRASGNRVEFWHLTFLEYLAARELAGIGDESQRKVLLKKEIIDDPNWRETLLLFIGVLWSQGRKKVEGFFGAMLDNIEKPCGDEENALTREARCFGLMGAMLRDLQPYDYHIGDNR
ncbi:MAG: NACHT domain-containing protein, partial [Fibrobacter sp.]|nr:NACHT domain-containing protein [Fibrobacter sp.]